MGQLTKEKSLSAKQLYNESKLFNWRLLIMAYGLGKYIDSNELDYPDASLMDQVPISLNDLMMAQVPENPAQMIPVPQVTKSQDLAALYDQKMRESAMQEQAGLEQLQQYIQDYQQKPRGIDWTGAGVALQNPQLIQAAQSMRPESEAEKSANILALQQKLQGARGNLTKTQLSALGEQLKMQQYAQAEMARKAAQDQRLQMEKQRSDVYEKTKAQELSLRKQDLEQRRTEMGMRQERADVRQQAGLSQKEQARIDNDVQKLEKRIGDMTPAIIKKLENLDQLIPGGLEAKTGDVPGAGPGKFLIPDVMLSNEASEIQQNARGLMADLIKLQSGTAASDQEVARKMKERGMAPGSKSETFRSGLRLLKSEINTALKNKEAGFRPEVKALYKDRGGLTHESVDAIGKKVDINDKLKRIQELKAKEGL